MITQSETRYQKPLLRRIIVTNETPHCVGLLPDDLLAELHRAAFAERCAAGEHSGAAVGMLLLLPATANEVLSIA